MWKGPEVVLCQPVVDRVGESKPAYEIVKALAERMGFGQYFPYEKWEDWGEVAMKNVPDVARRTQGAGILGRRDALPPGARGTADTIREDRDSVEGVRGRRIRGLPGVVGAAVSSPMPNFRFR